MIDGLISGRLYGKPQCRTGPSGRQFVTAKVRVATGAETIFVNCIAFADTPKAVLLELDDGDSVAISGSRMPKVWTDKHGEAKPALDMVAHALTTLYHVRRRRSAVQPEAGAPERTTRSPAPRAAPQDRSEAFVDDSLDDAF